MQIGDPEAGVIGADGVGSERRGQSFGEVEEAPVPHPAARVTGKKELGGGVGVGVGGRV